MWTLTGHSDLFTVVSKVTLIAHKGEEYRSNTGLKNTSDSKNRTKIMLKSGGLADILVESKESTGSREISYSSLQDELKKEKKIQSSL